jgi:hypothetical protein
MDFSPNIQYLPRSGPNVLLATTTFYQVRCSIAKHDPFCARLPPDQDQSFLGGSTTSPRGKIIIDERGK